jgi:hypothetical protein
MLHVFVETNWAVAYAAPAHMQVPAAAQLIEKARSGKAYVAFAGTLPDRSQAPASEQISASRDGGFYSQVLRMGDARGQGRA